MSATSFCKTKTMITLHRIKNTDSDEYRFTEELLTTAFPPDEYRPLEEQRRNASHEERFSLMIAKQSDTPVGFISFWDLGGISYVEHLATHPAMRDRGIGKAVIERFKEMADKIVLEVELPADSLSQRRIKFYQRNGFTLCDTPYTQPPYRKGGNRLPMLLMFCGCEITPELFAKTKTAIYKTIYNYDE